MTSPAEYVARGWKIFPCHSIQRGRCTCSKGIDCESPGKHPHTHSGFKDASSDLSVIRAWESRWPQANWAVATGRESAMVVIDIDPRNGGFDSIDDLEENRPEGPLPDTLRSLTGGGGRHLFYAYPPDIAVPSRKPWLPGVDVKSDGGYVILPEGEHISGGRYKWVDFLRQPSPLPPDLIMAISSRQAAAQSDLPPTTDVLKGVPMGERDNTLFRLACRLRRQLQDRTAVEILILQAAANCDPPFPAEEARRKVEQAFLQDHTDSFVEWRQGTGKPIQLHPLTDLGNARRFLDAFGQDVLYVGGLGWLTWTEIGWRRDESAFVAAKSHQLSALIVEEARTMEGSGSFDQDSVNRHLKWATKSEASDRMNAAVAVAKNVQLIRRVPDDFDADDHLLACRNGIVDLRTGAIRRIDRDDLVTKNTGVLYDSQFTLPQWDQFIARVCNFDDELISYLQRAVGYTLTGSNKEEALFLLSGPPASGKSTYLDGVHAAAGAYATTTQADTFMWSRNQQPPTLELARMAGIRLVSMSEIKEGASFDENLVKTVTGGDPVTGKFLYENPFTFRPKFKLWIGTNHDPGAKDDALWRRIKKIEFPNPIPLKERDKDLKIMLRDPDLGGKAVLAWAVRGAMEWYERGLDQPASISQAVEDYRVEQDQITQFKTEVLIMTAENVWLNDVYRAYKTWCQMTGTHAKPRQPFEKMIKARDMKVGHDDAGRPYVMGFKIKQEYTVWSAL